MQFPFLLDRACNLQTLTLGQINGSVGESDSDSKEDSDELNEDSGSDSNKLDTNGVSDDSDGHLDEIVNIGEASYVNDFVENVNPADDDEQDPEDSDGELQVLQTILTPLPS